MEQSSRKNSTAWKAAKANHTQKSSSLPVTLASPLPASLHQAAPASLSWISWFSKLLHGSESFFDHHHLRPTDAFKWKRSVNLGEIATWSPLDMVRDSNDGSQILSWF